MEEENKNKEAKTGEGDKYFGCVFWGLFIVLALMGFGLYKCSQDGDTDFPPEYYQSIQREQYFKDYGMDEEARQEQLDRKRKLKDGTYSLEKR